MNLFAGQQWRRRHREQTVDTAGEGEGGTNGETSMETYTLPYVKYIASGNLLYDAGRSNPTEKGGRGWEAGGSYKKEGSYLYLWLIHVDTWQKPIQYCKAIIFQLKINYKKKNFPPK